MNTAPPAAFKPRRGRPTADQAAAIDQAILSAARKLFFADGFDAVSMEGVATATGISKGTLYARHSSKEALLTAVIEDSIQTWSLIYSVNDHLLKDSIEERLRHHGRTIAQSLLEPDVRALMRLLIGCNDRFPTFSRTIHDLGFAYIVNLVAGDITAAAQRDGIAARDPLSVARMFVSGIFGWQFQEGSARHVTTVEREAMVDRFVALFMAARPDW